MQAGTTLKFRELQIKLHADREDFHFEDFIVVSSENSQSGNWEVWQLDREGEDQAKRFEDIEFLPSDRLLEVISEETLTESSIYDILCALQIGFQAGEESGANRVRRSFRFAMASLTGEIDGDDLDQAAEEYEHRQRR